MAEIDTNWIYLSSNKRYAPKILAEDIGIKIEDDKIYINNKLVTAIYCSDGKKYKKCQVYIGDENNQPKPAILDNTIYLLSSDNYALQDSEGIYLVPN